jgi:iron(III) transport system permease protein
LTILLPLGVLLLQSLSAGPALSFDPVSLTLSHYRAIFLTNQYGLSLANSVLLAIITATAGVLLTLPVAYSVQRSQLWLLRTALYLLTFLPFLLPGVVLGLTYFILISWSYRLGSLQLSLHFLYNSFLLAVIVSLVKHLPFGVQSHLNALLQLDPSLEEAAYVFRASFRRVLRRIFLPLVRPGSLVAWLLLFIFVFKEIDILAFVYAPLAFSTGNLSLSQFTRTPPIMYRIFTMINSEQYPELYAQGTALLLLTCLILLAVTLLVVRLGWHPSVLTTTPLVTGPGDEPYG